MHLLATIGIVATIAMAFGAGYGVLAFFGLVWLHTLMWLAMGFSEAGKERRAMRIREEREQAQRNRDRQLEALVHRMAQGVDD